MAGIEAYSFGTGFASHFALRKLRARCDMLSLFASRTQGALAPCSSPQTKRPAQGRLLFVEMAGIEPACN